MNQSRFIVLTVSAILMMLLSSVAFGEIRIGIGYAADRSSVDVFIEKFPRLKYAIAYLGFSSIALLIYISPGRINEKKSDSDFLIRF